MLRSLLQGRPLRHPLHPILIHFVVAAFVLSLVLDLLNLVLDRAGVYLEASLYVMTFGLAMAVLAAIPGVVDGLAVRRDAPARRLMLTHLLLNVLVIAVFAVNLWLRWGPWDDAAAAPEDRVSALGLLLSLVGVGLITASAYLGGRMVYGHGVAVGRHRREWPAPRRTIRVSSEASPDGFATVARADTIGDGETLRVDVDGVVMTVVCADGGFYAVQEFCTHRFGPLSEGTVHECRLECPWHRSEFEVATGAVVRGPAKIDLDTHQVRVQDGEVQVRVGGAAVPAV